MINTHLDPPVHDMIYAPEVGRGVVNWQTLLRLRSDSILNFSPCSFTNLLIFLSCIISTISQFS